MIQYIEVSCKAMLIGKAGSKWPIERYCIEKANRNMTIIYLLSA